MTPVPVNDIVLSTIVLRYSSDHTWQDTKECLTNNCNWYYKINGANEEIQTYGEMKKALTGFQNLWGLLHPNHDKVWNLIMVFLIT